MRKMALGKTGLMVSEFGVGGIPLTRLEPDAGAELVRYCFEQGLNFFDSSPKYEDSELKMGRGLRGGAGRGGPGHQDHGALGR